MPVRPSSITYPEIGGYHPRDTRDDLVYYGYPSVTERLLEYCLMDVVFVAVDFQNSNILCGDPDPRSITKHGNVRGYYGAQAGISILDTRDLKKSPETAVTARQFCVGGRWYCDTVPWRLLFGTSESHTMESLYTTMTTTLTNLLRFEDPITKELRPIVVIGHKLQPNSHKGHIDCLHKFTDPSIRSPIIDYLDTNQERVVYKSLVFGLGTSEFRSPSLMEILEHLSIPFANLHVAANDAMFTLRAILLMTVQDYRGRDQNLTSAERTILAELEGIALVPLSPPPGMQISKTAFPNKGGLVRKAKRNNFAVTKKARREPGKEQKMEFRNRTGRNDDWADVDHFIPPWDLENEQISTDNEHLQDAEPDQTPITTDDESLQLSNLSCDESSDDSEGDDLEDTEDVLISSGFVKD